MKIKIKYMQMMLFFFLAACGVYLIYVNNAIYKITLILVNLCMFLSVIIFYKSKLYLSKESLLMFLWLIYNGLSYLWAKPKYNFNMYLVLVYIVVTYIILYNYLKTENQLIYLLNMIIISSIILVLYIISYYGWDSMLNSRINNDLLNSNIAGRESAFSLFISVFLFFYTRKKIYVIIQPLLLGMVLLSGSKGSLLVLVILISVFFLLKDEGNFLKRIKSLVLLISILALILFLIMNIKPIYDIIGFRIEVFFEVLNGQNVWSSDKTSTDMRMYFIQNGFKLFKSKPLFGYGLDTYRYNNAYNTYSHSNFIEILVDLGIFGIFLFYGIYILLLKEALKYKKKMNRIWFAFIIAILSNVVIDAFTTINFNELFYFLIICVMYSYIRISKNSSEDLKI